jgi:prepilin-type N-terminal cleavage/methylation domain-containing protein
MITRRSPIQSAKQGATAGFSLIELLISLAVFLIISAMVMGFMFDMTMTQGTVANRSEMHSSVRSATQILQQEISQAGRITFPDTNAATTDWDPPTLTAAIALNAAAQTVGVSNTNGMFGTAAIPMLVIVGSGATEETVAAQVVTYGAPGTISAIFRKNHVLNDPVRPAGSFINGILTYTNGSTLMMFGDINDTGNMVFVRYDCIPTDAGDGVLWRREMPWDTAPVLATINTNYPPRVLLNNLQNVPPGAANLCFTFQHRDMNWPSLDNAAVTKLATLANLNPAVLNVAVTMSSRTQARDPRTNEYQYQTKALLTVSPRNVFQAYNMASNLTGSQHVQETPPQITALAALNLTPP